MKVRITVGVILGLLLPIFTTSIALGRGFEVKSFYNPVYEGYQLDWCLEWQKKCGEAAAEAWCRWKNYDRVIDWKKKNNIGLRSPTKVMRGGRVCAHSNSDGFEWISCERFDDKLRSIKACLNIGNQTGAGAPTCQGEQGHNYGKAGRFFIKGETVWVLLRLNNLPIGKHVLTTTVNRGYAGRTTGSTAWAQRLEFSNTQSNWWFWFSTKARDSCEWVEHIRIDGERLGYVKYCVDCLSID